MRLFVPTVVNQLGSHIEALRQASASWLYPVQKLIELRVPAIEQFWYSSLRCKPDNPLRSLLQPEQCYSSGVQFHPQLEFQIVSMFKPARIYLTA